MKRIIFILLTVFLVGCESKTPHYLNIDVKHLPRGDKEALLIKNFSSYWNARVEGNIEKSFSYELPYQKYIDGIRKYSSKILPLNNKTKIVLKNIRYLSPNVVIIDRLIKIDEKEFLKKDKWIYVEGNWYHKYYQNILPPTDEEEALFQ